MSGISDYFRKVSEKICVRVCIVEKIWYKYIRSVKNIVVFAETAEQSGKKKKIKANNRTDKGEML